MLPVKKKPEDYLMDSDLPADEDLRPPSTEPERPLQQLGLSSAPERAPPGEPVELKDLEPPAPRPPQQFEPPPPEAPGEPIELKDLPIEAPAPKPEPAPKPMSGGQQLTGHLFDLKAEAPKPAAAPKTKNGYQRIPEGPAEAPEPAPPPKPAHTELGQS
jgi:hypothetical protein